MVITIMKIGVKYNNNDNSNKVIILKMRVIKIVENKE